MIEFGYFEVSPITDNDFQLLFQVGTKALGPCFLVRATCYSLRLHVAYALFLVFQNRSLEHHSGLVPTWNNDVVEKQIVIDVGYCVRHILDR